MTQEVKEIWKPVVGFEGLYEVSNAGKVRSVDRYINGKNGSHSFINGIMMKLQTSHKGYYNVVLHKNGNHFTKAVHRLVAEAFIPNPKNKMFVDHINTDTTDCRACNLRWVTAKENANNPISS